MQNVARVRDGLQVMLMNRFYVLSISAEDIFAMPQEVFTSSIEMIAERGFPLLKPFNQRIRMMKDVGIMTKLDSDFLYNATILEPIRSGKKEEEVRIVLTVEHLQGAFTVLILGLMLSGVAFALEVINATDRLQRWKHTSAVWIRCHILIYLTLQEPIRPLKMYQKRYAKLDEKLQKKQGKYRFSLNSWKSWFSHAIQRSQNLNKLAKPAHK